MVCFPFDQHHGQKLIFLSADALQVGKIKNKVLKLTGEVQALQIEVSNPGNPSFTR
jgi:hypothetical protein